MAHECLLGILEDLGADDFKQFQWYLQKDSNGSIPKSKLENKTRLETVDVMTQTYADEAMAVTKPVLEKIKRKDLLVRLSGCKGAAATPQNSQDVAVVGAEEKLTSVRDEFVKRVSEPLLNSLVDKLHVQKIILNEEMEAIAEKVNDRAGKARKFIDILRAKGDEPCSLLIGMVGKLDPSLSKLLRW